MAENLMRQEFESIVYQLLWVGHLWMQEGIDIQGIDPQGVGGITLFFRQ